MRKILTRRGGMNRIQHGIEAIIFASRWLVVVLQIGLVVGLATLVYKFALKLFDFVVSAPGTNSTEIILGVLGLVDLLLTANLVLIVICSTYENFVAPIDPARHPNWPAGLTGIGFSGLKQKLLGSIVAIAAVNTLEWFADIEHHADAVKLAWVVGMMMAFAVTMLILALADRLSDAHK